MQQIFFDGKCERNKWERGNHSIYYKQKVKTVTIITSKKSRCLYIEQKTVGLLPFEARDFGQRSCSFTKDTWDFFINDQVVINMLLLLFLKGINLE